MKERKKEKCKANKGLGKKERKKEGTQERKKEKK